ncbi:MAG TPA: DUF3047 domain-containing protein [Verrucomicrobiae bacterium]|jgi:hypothetical protein|nr:DUF3047 domain-containing protein [Verrucomicrobiae bacterium]
MRTLLPPVLALHLAAVALLLAAPTARAEDCIVLDDFSHAKVGEFPTDWKPRKDAGRTAYTVREESGRRFLQAISEGLGIQAAKEQSWDLAQYPVLAWSWRLQEHPKGSDERQSKTNDSALSVYAVWPHTSVSVKALKYVWSRVAPVGTPLTSSAGLTQGRVLRSGDADKGEWVEARANVAEDFRARFKETEAPKPAGIAVLTDSDDTKSRAAGDYAAFRACKP